MVALCTANGMRRRPSILHFCFVVAGQLGRVAADVGFHREACYGRVTEMLQSNSSSITTNPRLFISISDPTNPILTLGGCRQLCGSGTGWYSDSVPRLVTWLLPVFLLVSNMQFAPIGGQRFLLILHLLGDPIDSIWSLLAKVDSWRRCFSQAQKLLKGKIETKSLALILAAAGEVSHALDHTLRLDAPETRGLIVETARTLSENRSNETRRTLFAIMIYVFSVLAAFVPAIGAAPSPSGGRIGTAILLSWLLYVVMLSNAVGDLGSRRNCQRIIAEFTKRLGQQCDQDSHPRGKSTLSLSFIGVHRKIETPYEASMAWSGAIYCYRPNKRFLHASGWKLAFLSVLPVAIAFGTAFAVLDTGPTYFSCRHILVIVVFIVYLISALLTSLLSWISFATGKYLWSIILIKDTIFAAPTLALIVASSCGLWNNCYCWSGALVYGEREAHVPLNPTKVFNRNNSIIYPAIVATCLILQACAFGTMLWVEWPGFSALWWSEHEKRMASELIRDSCFSSPGTEMDAVEIQPVGILSNGHIENTP